MLTTSGKKPLRATPLPLTDVLYPDRYMQSFCQARVFGFIRHLLTPFQVFHFSRLQIGFTANVSKFLTNQISGIQKLLRMNLERALCETAMCPSRRVPANPRPQPTLSSSPRRTFAVRQKLLKELVVTAE